MLILSIRFSTRATLPGIRQTHTRIPAKTPNERARFTLAWAMDSVKQLPRPEWLPAELAAPEHPSFFVSLPSDVAFQRGVPEFAVRFHLLRVKGLRSGP